MSVGEKMSDNNLKQQINIKYCVMISKSANETLILAYGEYTMKKSVFLNGTGGSR
jgi:hypothetical protein